MVKRSTKYKKRLRKYAKTTRHYVDAGVSLWNRLNTSSNKKKMASLGKRASRMQENLIRNI